VTGLLADGHAGCGEPAGLTAHLTTLLVEDPPAGREGGAIRPGADAELDALLAAAGDARSYIATLETAERERTGIRSLRVGYNRVFGYFIEVPNAHRESVPEAYARQTKSATSLPT
jgi:DNA mismatch repair protein MutS